MSKEDKCIFGTVLFIATSIIILVAYHISDSHPFDRFARFCYHIIREHDGDKIDKEILENCQWKFRK